MTGGHIHALFHHGSSPLHRLAPECKLGAGVLFVLAVVGTPREAFWAFGVYAVLVAALAVLAALPPLFVARRMSIELPFVAFAFFLPFVGGGPRVELAGAWLSIEGLWAAWNILAKGTLGVATMVIVAGTTPVPDILKAMERLRAPTVFVAVAGFMVRYLDVVVGEMHRMMIALRSRAYAPRWLGQARPLGRATAALFVRSYERGERVYLAMLSRGYVGSMPDLGGERGAPREWAIALLLPLVGASVAVGAWMVRS